MSKGVVSRLSGVNVLVYANSLLPSNSRREHLIVYVLNAHTYMYVRINHTMCAETLGFGGDDMGLFVG